MKKLMSFLALFIVFNNGIAQEIETSDVSEEEREVYCAVREFFLSCADAGAEIKSKTATEIWTYCKEISKSIDHEFLKEKEKPRIIKRLEEECERICFLGYVNLDNAYRYVKREAPCW